MEGKTYHFTVYQKGNSKLGPPIEPQWSLNDTIKVIQKALNGFNM